jgi:hypothetical protein
MFTMENCTFEDCTANGEPIPNVTILWWCSCGHPTKADHIASLPPPSKWRRLIQWFSSDGEVGK